MLENAETDSHLPAVQSSSGRDLVRHEPEVVIAPNGKVAGYADRINENWRKTVEGILRVSKDCADAKRELTRSEKQELYGRLPFGESMFSKLAMIGDDMRLFNHQLALPPSISSLYLVGQWSNLQFEAALEEGVLRPDATRGDLEAWASRAAPSQTSAESEESNTPQTRYVKVRVPARLYCVVVDELPPEEQRSAWNQEFFSWAEEKGMEVVVFTGESFASEYRSFLQNRTLPT